MTSKQAQQLVAFMVDGFPKCDWSPAFQRIFASRIEELDYEPAKRAACCLIDSATFPPAIAEFKAAYVAQLRGEKRPALDAWGDVVRAVRYVGRCETPKWKDPMVGYVVHRLGWEYFCDSDDPDGVKSKRFCDLYEATTDAEVRAAQIDARARPPERLGGIIGGLLLPAKGKGAA